MPTRPFTKPLRIAQVATADMSVRLLLESQIRALTAAGHDVTAVSASGPYTEEIRARGIRLDTIAMERELSPLRDLSSLAKLVYYFTEKKFDIVNTHTPKAGLIAPLAAQLAGVRAVIHTVHGFLFHDDMKPLRKFAGFGAERITAQFSQYLFFQAHEDLETAARLHFLPRSRLHYIGNGIDISRFSKENVRPRDEVRQELNLQPTDMVIGMVARLTYEKGAHEFFEMVRRLGSKPNRYKFILVGGEDKQQNDAVTANDITEMKERFHVQFLGMRRDVQDLYRAFDIFVLPSHREGIPRAAMEASALESAVVTTNIRGCREVVIHRETGELVDVKNVAALCAAVEKLANDAELRQRYGQKARERIVSHFDERDVNNRILSGFHEVAVREGIRA